MRTRRRVELPVTALISLIHKENLGEPHAVLAGGERYISPRFQQEAERALRDELSDAGLDDDRLRARLALIQHARTEYYGWVTRGGEQSAVLVAAVGRAAAVVTRTGQRVTVAGADADRLVESLVHRLPEVPAGRGESISVRAADYTQPAAGDRRRPSPRTQDARRLDTLLRAPRLGGARLYTARRDHTGTRRRAADWISVLDLAGHGRWAVYATAGRGERFVNAVPASPQLLVTKLTELHRSLA